MCMCLPVGGVQREEPAVGGRVGLRGRERRREREGERKGEQRLRDPERQSLH